MAEPEGIERAVLDAVEGLGVDYEPVWIDPAYAKTAEFCAHYGFEPDASGNCIVVASKTGERRHCACVVPATRHLDVNRTVRKLMGVRKASFAPADETEALTGMVPDGVTPFALPAGVPVYLDVELMGLERVVVGGGSRRLKLSVPPEALTALDGAEVVDELSRPPA